MKIVKISEDDWYSAIEYELEAGTVDYESAHDEVYRYFKRENSDADLDIPHNAVREKEIKDWLRECDA